ncbi:MAG: methyl coenzyme M reductase-arginine methyltransferase Mmp10 [Methanotrichaceae archaeon]|nr:methyl coenzyme M reductase-arginine methyltransferase Mmp10 [Methanotrichaceae archaeon]
MQVTVDVGGRPGLDCKGFCSFCYFKGVKRVEPSGCRQCKPYKKGCDYCSREVIEIEPGYKPLDQLIFEVSQKSASSTPEMVIIKGNGDISCYPHLLDLVRTVSDGKVPVFLDYTSGKGFTKKDEAGQLVDAGVQRISFSIFSTNPDLRRKFVNDKHPEIVLSNFRTFCERSELYAMIVLIPGVNDGMELEKTCQDLQDMGAKGLMLMSFANSREQGLIFGNEPVMPGIIPYGVEDIRRIATQISKNYDMRVIGTPLWDPLTGAPFALAHHKKELKRLPAIERSATIITSSVAYPLLSSIFQELGNEVNVVATKKEIGNLITQEDFENLGLKDVKDRVIIPGMVLAHDRDIHKALRRDGRRRLVFRGPDELTVVSERSIYITPEEVLEKEIEAFTGLIMQINELGSPIPEYYADKKSVQEGCVSSKHIQSHSPSRDRAVQAS